MSYFPEISQRLAALSGSATPLQVRQALNEFNVRDINAVSVSEGGTNGGASIRHEVVTFGFADINATTGMAPLYLLQENEVLIACWFVCTEAFNGTDSFASGFTSAQAFSPGGSASGVSVSDSFDFTAPSTVQDGIVGPDAHDLGSSGTTTLMLALCGPVPGGGAQQLVIDFGAGNVPLTTAGTTGAALAHLIIGTAA